MKNDYSGRSWPTHTLWAELDEDDIFPPEEMLTGTIMDREVYLDELTDMVSAGLSTSD